MPPDFAPLTPKVQVVDDKLILEFTVPPDADLKAVGEALARLVQAMNAYHIAAGGHGLAIDDWRIEQE